MTRETFAANLIVEIEDDFQTGGYVGKIINPRTIYAFRSPPEGGLSDLREAIAENIQELSKVPYLEILELLNEYTPKLLHPLFQLSDLEDFLRRLENIVGLRSSVFEDILGKHMTPRKSKGDQL